MTDDIQHIAQGTVTVSEGSLIEVLRQVTRDALVAGVPCRKICTIAPADPLSASLVSAQLHSDDLASGYGWSTVRFQSIPEGCFADIYEDLGELVRSYGGPPMNRFGMNCLAPDLSMAHLCDLSIAHPAYQSEGRIVATLADNNAKPYLQMILKTVGISSYRAEEDAIFTQAAPAFLDPEMLLDLVKLTHKVGHFATVASMGSPGRWGMSMMEKPCFGPGGAAYSLHLERVFDLTVNNHPGCRFEKPDELQQLLDKYSPASREVCEWRYSLAVSRCTDPSMN